MAERMPPMTIDEVIRRLPPVRSLPRLPVPEYRRDGAKTLTILDESDAVKDFSDAPKMPKLAIGGFRLDSATFGNCDSRRIFLSVESFRRHMTDEGWQIQAGMEEAGYQLWGHGLPNGETDVPKILERTRPITAIIQDPREWDAKTVNCFVKEAQFHRAEILGQRPSIFKVSTLKDAHRDGKYYRQKAEEFGVHAWIIYYHPRIVAHLAPWARPEHFIRTWHTVEPADVPAFKGEGSGKKGCVLSGALGDQVYPLRTRIARAVARGRLQGANSGVITLHKHPGYHAGGSCTPSFLRMLSGFKVSICTASIFGFSLRKIIESTACGCRVVTDLPVDEVVPWIDGNLIRVHRDESPEAIVDICREAEAGWREDGQREFAELACSWFDWRLCGQRLAYDVERVRVGWGQELAENRENPNIASRAGA